MAAAPSNLRNNVPSTSNQYSTERSVQPPKTNRCAISFQNLTYQREVKVQNLMNISQWCCGQRVRVQKQLLCGVTGIMKPGLNAIMGPSGSGKTTLLNVLSHRSSSKGLSGSLCFNGEEKRRNLSEIIGFVPQNDCIMGVLTVKENIWFSANLRLTTSITNEEKRQRIEEIITELALESCQNTKIGTERIRGVSGGERKRTAIGMELVVQPSVIFLDEPTCGLDASTAHAVMMLLKWLTLKGTNIIFTIHQPRFSIYQLFDSLTLIAKGRLVFHSPTRYVMPYFRSIGYECRENENPPDYLQDVISGDVDMETGNPEADNEELTQEQITLHIERLAMLFRSSPLHSNLVREIQDEADGRGSSVQPKALMKSQRSSFSTQFLYLSQRAFKNLIRNPMALVSNAITNIIIGLIFGLIYFKTNEVYVAGIQNRFGFFFFVCSNMLFGTLGTVELFFQEKEVFMHEHKSGHYGVFPYFLSKVFADLLPLRTISPLLFCCVTYWMVGLKPDVDSFFTFVLTVLLLVYSAAGIGMLFSTSFKDCTAALIMVTLSFFFAVMLSGFLINSDSILPWLRWIEYLSIARYGFIALCVNEFHDHAFVDCTGVVDHMEFVLPGNSTGIAITAVQPSGNETVATKRNGTGCVLFRGDEILERQLSLHPANEIEFDGWYLWQNHVALATVTCTSFLLAYVQLVRATRSC